MNLAEAYRSAARLCLVLALIVAGLATVQSVAKAEVAVSVAQTSIVAAEANMAPMETVFRVGCPFAPPEDNKFHIYTGQNCSGTHVGIGITGRIGNCYNLTIHGTPPNGWSNLMRSGYNSSGVAIAFWDQFGCNNFQGGTLFAMNDGTARPTLNALADKKASSYCVSLFPLWHPEDTCNWGPP